MIGIIGGGFGLYGWMPAVANHYPDEKILMESRHKEKFFNRPELHIYLDKIEWVKTPRDIIFKGPNILILAIPPKSTKFYLESISHSNSIKTLIVDKPICETPEKSDFFIETIEAKGIKIFCPFIFRFNSWFLELSDFLKYSKEEVITIDWFFTADHYKFNKDNWKKDHNQGGGPLRFYGIHLIAVLMELGYTPSRQSLDEVCYFGVFTKENFPDVIVRVNTRADNDKFEIKGLVDQRTPFDRVVMEYTDDRIALLRNFLSYTELFPGELSTIQKLTVEAWKQIEQQIKS